MESSSINLLVAVITFLTAILGGAFIAIKRVKKKNQKSDQRGIQIKGDGNKIIGGDDNSKA